MAPLSASSFKQIHSTGGTVHVSAQVESCFGAAGLADFESWMALYNIPFREVSMRPQRPVVSLTIPGIQLAVFLKRNLDAPRQETLFQRLGLTETPSEAWKEVHRLGLFEQAGIRVPEVVAWGEGNNRKEGGSFVATLDLEALPAERFIFREFQPPLSHRKLVEKHRLITELAELTRRMHRAGLVHRDYYLGHVFVSPERGNGGRLSVIDVQRASRRPSWWLRSQIKDLASLHFSADPEFIRQSERIHFLKDYWGTDHLGPWHRTLVAWIDRKAMRIRRHTEKALGIPYSEYFRNKYY